MKITHLFCGFVGKYDSELCGHHWQLQQGGQYVQGPINGALVLAPVSTNWESSNTTNEIQGGEGSSMLLLADRAEMAGG